MAKGKIIIEGAKAFCSSSQANKNKGAAVPIKVTSQKKKLGKNKYFAQDKPIATYIDDKAENFNNGEGFVMCQDPKNTSTGYSPCKAKCNIKYKDYYENVDFNKSMKVLLDISTGTCPGYGVPGTIEFADSGQKAEVSQIDVKEADAFSIVNTSPQWETVASTTATSVSKISFLTPAIGKPVGTYYYIKEIENPLSFSQDTIIKLQAEYKGDTSKISWALFKGTGTKDKIKTFIGIGANIKINLNKLFNNLEEGNYRIEAYGKSAGDPNCAILIEYVKDHIEGIEVAGASTIKNILVPVSIKYKVNAVRDHSKILNNTALNGVNTSPIVNWRIKKEGAVLYNNNISKDSSLITVQIVKNYVSLSPVASIAFKNAGKYIIEAYTDPQETKPHSVTIEVKDTYGVNNVKHKGSGLLRYNDFLEVSVGNYSVDILPASKTVQWYLQKDGVHLKDFEKAVISTNPTIKRRIDHLLYNDAKAGSNYFGKYKIEAYGKAITANKTPDFSGNDTFSFEVIKNVADKITLPLSIPKGAKVKYEASARIMPLIADEKLVLELPENVINNNDGTLTFKENGEFTIETYVTGEHTNPTKVNTTVKVATPIVKRALWSYKTGYKRTETGFKEESYGFVEIEGLTNLSLKTKIWVKGEYDTYYAEPEKYLLEEKNIALNDKGKGSFKITVNDDYKKKIEEAIPKTTENPNPNYRLVFTIEIPQNNNTITTPDALEILNANCLDGKNMYSVLDTNEELVVTNEQKVKSIVFATEDGKNVQQTITHYNKTHKIWVHTVNMIDEELKIDVLKEIPNDSLTASSDIVYTHESKQTYAAEKVGSDGLLEVSFTTKEEWKNPPKNVDYYIAQVAKKVKDANNPSVESYVLLKSQIIANNSLPASIEHDKEMEKMGIKAKKANGTPFTLEEMVALRKKFINYEQGALKVAQTEATPEAIENSDVFVEVESAEIEVGKTCYCNKDLTEDDVKAIIKNIKGSELIFNHKDCTIQDKSIKSFTLQLNMAFRKYDINTCIQKITFLAQAFHESDNFNTAEEYPSNHNSSKSVYKGRGLIQMTGVKGTGSDFYDEPGPYQTYANYLGNQEIISTPELIAQELKYAVDSAGWLWSQNKKVPNWDKNSENEAIKFKAEHFKDGLGKSLNEVAIIMENVDENKYFYLQSKILNGYFKDHKLEKDPNGWDDRKDAFTKLKSWFKYNKEVCKNGGIIPNLTGRAPWMQLAWLEEAKKLVETGTNKEIQKYFDGTPYEKAMKDNSKNEEDIAWCAAFINWIMKHYGYEGVTTDSGYDAVRALKWANWAEGVDLKKPVYGAIAVKTRSGGGHVGFVAGKKGEKIVILGGNQSQKLYCVAYNVSDYFAYIVPSNYEITESDYNLPEYNGNPGEKGSEL